VKLFKHYSNSILSYISRIIYTFILSLFLNNYFIIFFIAYFLVIFQSFLINSKIIFNTTSDRTLFIKFITFNLTLSGLEFIVFSYLFNFVESLILVTALSAVTSSALRFVVYKKYIFKN